MTQPSPDDVRRFVSLQEHLEALVARELEASGLLEREEEPTEEEIAEVTQAAFEGADEELIEEAAMRGLLGLVLEAQAERHSN